MLALHSCRRTRADSHLELRDSAGSRLSFCCSSPPSEPRLSGDRGVRWSKTGEQNRMTPYHLPHSTGGLCCNRKAASCLWAAVVSVALIGCGKRTCVTVDLSDFDTSCVTSADCVLVRSGELCSGYCDCPGDTVISRSEFGRYQTAISSVPPAAIACPCVSLPAPKCVQRKCVFCGGSQQSCPDGG